MITEGNLVNAGGSDPVLATIVSVDPIYIYFDVDERSLQRYAKSPRRVGDPAGIACARSKLPFTLRAGDRRGFPHTGLIDFADNQVDSQTGTIQVRGVVPNPERPVRARLARADPRARSASRTPVLLVPDTAILTDQDKRYVLALDDKNVVQRRDVELGKLLDDGSRVVRPAQRRRAASPPTTGSSRRAFRWRGSTIRSSRSARRPTDAGDRGCDRRAGGGTLAVAVGGVSVISHFFIDRPIFATVLSIVIVIVGGVALTQLPDRAVPGGRAADRPGHRDLPRRQRQDRRRHRRHADRAGGQRRREHALHVVALHQRRPDDSRRHVRAGHQPGHGPGAGAEPRRRSPQAKLPEEVKRHRRDDQEEVAEHPAVRQPDLARTAAYDQLYLSNFATLNVKDDLARIKGVGDVTFLGPRDYSMRVWLDPRAAGVAADDARRRDQRHPASRTCRSRPGRSASRRCRRAQTSRSTCRSTPQGRLDSEEQFEKIIVKTGADGQLVYLRDVVRTTTYDDDGNATEKGIELGAKNYDVNSYLGRQGQRYPPSRWPSSSCPAPTRSRPPRPSRRRWRS